VPLPHECGAPGGLDAALLGQPNPVIDLLDAPVFFINDTSALGLRYKESCQRH
jgi:hypothetical protein